MVNLRFFLGKAEKSRKGRTGSYQNDYRSTSSWWTFRIFFIFFLLGGGSAANWGIGGGAKYYISGPKCPLFCRINSASSKPTTDFAQSRLSRVKGRSSPVRAYKSGCVCSYMAGHYPGIPMTGHIGTNTPKFVPSRWG